VVEQRPLCTVTETCAGIGASMVDDEESAEVED